jgi:hypothetical protein
MVCAFGSTIELYLALSPWATINDSKVMDEIPVVANANYLMDKGYEFM